MHNVTRTFGESAMPCRWNPRYHKHAEGLKWNIGNLLGQRPEYFAWVQRRKWFNHWFKWFLWMPLDLLVRILAYLLLRLTMNLRWHDNLVTISLRQRESTSLRQILYHNFVPAKHSPWFAGKCKMQSRGRGAKQDSKLSTFFRPMQCKARLITASLMSADRASRT